VAIAYRSSLRGGPHVARERISLHAIMIVNVPSTPGSGDGKTFIDHGCITARQLQVVAQLVDADHDGEDTRQYRRIEHDGIFGTAFDPDGYHFPRCPESSVSTFLRPTSSWMRSNSLPMYPHCGEGLIPLVVLTVAAEYDSASWVLTGVSSRREGHQAFSPHLCDVGQG
jgi:hypothetical protein